MPTEYIDVTPTWSGILPALVMLVENSDAIGRRDAILELTRMADLASRYVVEHHGKATVISLTQQERSDIVDALGSALDETRYCLNDPFAELDGDPGYTDNLRERIERYEALLEGFTVGS